jgi:putative hydrolase
MAGLHKRTPYMGTSKEKNTKAIINAIKQGMVDIITHPVSWNFPIDIYSIIDVASEYNVLLEANKTILLEALYRKKENTIVDYKKILMEAESAGVHIIWGSDAHHVSEMLLSDQEFQYLSSVYEFDFSKVINNKPDDLLTLLYNRRQGK